MKFLLFALTVLSLSKTYAQQFSPFRWADSVVTFSGVEMDLRDNVTQKQIFKGYKNSKIVLTNLTDDPKAASITIKLGGYFQMVSAPVDSFAYEIKRDGYTFITYTAFEGNKVAAVVIRYDPSSTKPDIIVAVVSNNYRTKPKKELIFRLKGFE